MLPLLPVTALAASQPGAASWMPVVAMVSVLGRQLVHPLSSVLFHPDVLQIFSTSCMIFCSTLGSTQCGRDCWQQAQKVVTQEAHINYSLRSLAWLC
jgi:hypothetical protein